MFKKSIALKIKKDQVVKNLKEKAVDVLSNEVGEFGIGSLITVAIAIIVVGFILIPGMRSFASEILSSMDSWWTNTVKGDIFPTS